MQNNRDFLTEVQPEDISGIVAGDPDKALDFNPLASYDLRAVDAYAEKTGKEITPEIMERFRRK